MVYLKYLLFIYAIFGFMVAGGLFFNRTNKANIFLALYTLLFSFIQLDFLYNSTKLVFEYPQFTALSFPIWLLLGPFIWLYIKHFNTSLKYNLIKESFHFIPSLFYSTFTIYLLMNFSGKERLLYFWDNFNTIIMPFNYGIAIHLSFYAILMIIFSFRNSNNWSIEKRFYINTIVSIYILTAVVESYLTVYAETYQWFLYYFLITSSIVFFIAYILFFKPEVLKKISKKYYSSGLNSVGKSRISNKINIYLSENKNIIDSKLNLQYLSDSIDEKKHNVSQTISEEFGMTFNEIVNKKRILFAQKLLSDKNNDQLKLFAIALDSGYTNKTTFHRAFVKYTNITPNEYRKKRGI